MCRPLFLKGKSMLRVICAWCGKFLRNLDDCREGVSHGICLECRDKYFPEEKSNG